MIEKGGIENEYKLVGYTLLTLVIIGAINWGLIGFFRFDLVAFIFGNMSGSPGSSMRLCRTRRSLSDQPVRALRSVDQA